MVRRAQWLMNHLATHYICMLCPQLVDSAGNQNRGTRTFGKASTTIIWDGDEAIENTRWAKFIFPNFGKTSTNIDLSHSVLDAFGQSFWNMCPNFWAWTCQLTWVFQCFYCFSNLFVDFSSVFMDLSSVFVVFVQFLWGFPTLQPVNLAVKTPGLDRSAPLLGRPEVRRPPGPRRCQCRWPHVGR